MRKEFAIILILIGTLAIRFSWAKLGWSGEHVTVYFPLLALILLLVFYHRRMQSTFYKVITLFFIIYIVAFIFNFLEWKGRGLLLFLGTLGFALFSVKFINTHKGQLDNPLIPYAISLGIILIIQTAIYLIFSSGSLLTFGHMLCFGIIILAGFIVVIRKLVNEISLDEKMILTFIIIVNILSLMGVTFKESFYSEIWI